MSFRTAHYVRAQEIKAAIHDEICSNIARSKFLYFVIICLLECNETWSWEIRTHSFHCFLYVNETRRPIKSGLCFVFFRSISSSRVSMKQIPCLEADNSWATQDTFPLVWNTESHRNVHESPSLVSIRSQFNPLHTVNFVALHCSVIFPSKQCFPSDIFSSGFRVEFCVCWKVL